MFHPKPGRTVPSIAGRTFCRLAPERSRIVLRFAVAAGSHRCHLWARRHILLGAVRGRWDLMPAGWAPAQIRSASWRLRGRRVRWRSRWGPRRGQRPRAVRCCGRLPWRMGAACFLPTRARSCSPGGTEMVVLPRLQRQESSSRRRGVAATAGISWDGARRVR